MISSTKLPTGTHREYREASLFAFWWAGACHSLAAAGTEPQGGLPVDARKDNMPHDPYYTDKKHLKWREAVLRKAGYLCEECKRYGRTDKNGLPVAATTAHHIKHRDEYPELQYDVSNGRALCDACHNKAHPEKF